MGAVRLSIQEFLQQSKDGLIIDVRSPGEYAHAHMPGAKSLPLFSDEERKIVGTTYKQQSRQQAIRIGLDMFGPKMRKMVEEVESLIAAMQLPAEANDASHDRSSALNTVFVYCWRGGMRSAAVAWLLDLYGFKVYTIAGGYKAFRNYVLQSFSNPFRLKIIGGFTGSGKTEVLNELKRKGEAVIDLEKIASHKGSAFGGINMPSQPTQEMFENILSLELENENHQQKNSFASHEIWIEDESQRIGNLNIPPALWETMRNSPLVFLEVSFEERLRYLVKEYGSCEKERLMDSVQRITKRLGPLDTKNTLAFLEEDNLHEAFNILLHYYDKQYLKGLHNRERLSALLTRVNCETVGTSNAHLLIKHQAV